MKNKKEEGSIELIVLALIASLILVLAIPLLGNIGTGVESKLSVVSSAVNASPSPTASN